MGQSDSCVSYKSDLCWALVRVSRLAPLFQHSEIDRDPAKASLGVGRIGLLGEWRWTDLNPGLKSLQLV